MNPKPQPVQQKAEANQETQREIYPLKIPESQGDLADRAEVEIEQEIEELIWRVQKRLREEENGQNTH